MTTEINLELANLTDNEFSRSLFSEINKYRRQNNLTVVGLDKKHATALSVDHCYHMIKTNMLSHQNFGERARLLKNNGASRVGEIVAWGYDSSKSVLNAWNNSSSHNEIILGEYTKIGIGIMENQQGKFFFTVLFYS